MISAITISIAGVLLVTGILGSYGNWSGDEADPLGPSQKLTDARLSSFVYLRGCVIQG
jgi:hypothetical protein